MQAMPQAQTWGTRAFSTRMHAHVLFEKQKLEKGLAQIRAGNWNVNCALGTTRIQNGPDLCGLSQARPGQLV